jgi:hypothetical protein
VNPDVSLDAFILRLFLLKLYLARDLAWIHRISNHYIFGDTLKTIDKAAPARYLAIEKVYPKVN